MILETINKELQNIGVPYEFMRWTEPVDGAYFVGELSEMPIATEDGQKESTLLLTGTTGGTWSELEQHRATIESHFDPIHGLRVATKNGAVVIFYENSFPVPTGDANLKRIQINLRCKEWRNNT